MTLRGVQAECSRLVGCVCWMQSESKHLLEAIPPSSLEGRASPGLEPLSSAILVSVVKCITFISGFFCRLEF